MKQNYLLRELLWPLSPVTSILGGSWVPLFKQNYLLRELLRPLSPVTRIFGGTRATLVKQNYLLRELFRPLSPLTSILRRTRAPLIKQNYLLSELLRPGAYLGFCQGGCTFLADLPPPPSPPDLDLDPDAHQDFELNPDQAPDPNQKNADPQPWAVLLIYFTRTTLLSSCSILEIKRLFLFPDHFQSFTVA
jgi:hypothetical protein